MVSRQGIESCKFDGNMCEPEEETCESEINLSRKRIYQTSIPTVGSMPSLEETKEIAAIVAQQVAAVIPIIIQHVLPLQNPNTQSNLNTDPSRCTCKHSNSCNLPESRGNKGTPSLLPRSKDKKKTKSSSKKKKKAKNTVTPSNQNFQQPANKRPYQGPYPKCRTCLYHHLPANPCSRCTNCNRVGHTVNFCKTPPANVNRQTNPQKFQQQPPQPNRACFTCGDPGHFRNQCPRDVNNNARPI